MPPGRIALVALLFCANDALAGSPVGTPCGGPSGLVCDQGLDCKHPGNRFDSVGVCAARPVGCSHDLDPVCGVNGFTYPNACVARAARVRLAHPGRC